MYTPLLQKLFCEIKINVTICFCNIKLVYLSVTELTTASMWVLDNINFVQSWAFVTQHDFLICRYLHTEMHK